VKADPGEFEGGGNGLFEVRGIGQKMTPAVQKLMQALD
jgi:hypothetical protein